MFVVSLFPFWERIWITIDSSPPTILRLPSSPHWQLEAKKTQWHQKKKLTKIPQMHTRTRRAHRTNGKEAKAITMKHTEENQTSREVVVWGCSGGSVPFWCLHPHIRCCALVVSDCTSDCLGNSCEPHFSLWLIQIILPSAKLSASISFFRGSCSDGTSDPKNLYR